MATQTFWTRKGIASSGLQTFSTNFPNTENPISLGGRMITVNSPGVNWTPIGGATMSPVEVYQPGLAVNVDCTVSSVDALACLVGTWRPNQSATCIIGNAPPVGSGLQQREIECHLRTDPRTGSTYEVTWGFDNYYLIAIWTPDGRTPIPFEQFGAPDLNIGDVLTATIIGQTITMYTNGVQVVQFTDNSSDMITFGNPGFGFNGGASPLYGISNFSAAELN